MEETITVRYSKNGRIENGIQMIKMIRGITGCSLRDAKYCYDRFVADMNTLTPSVYVSESLLASAMNQGNKAEALIYAKQLVAGLEREVIR